MPVKLPVAIDLPIQNTPLVVVVPWLLLHQALSSADNDQELHASFSYCARIASNRRMAHHNDAASER